MRSPSTRKTGLSPVAPTGLPREGSGETKFHNQRSRKCGLRRLQRLGAGDLFASSDLTALVDPEPTQTPLSRLVLACILTVTDAPERNVSPWNAAQLNQDLGLTLHARACTC